MLRTGWSTRSDPKPRSAIVAQCVSDKIAGATIARREVYISQKEGSMGDC
jgi:hypothetical protein